MSIRTMALALLAGATLLCAASPAAHAQDEQDAAAFVQSLHFRSGTIEVPEYTPLDTYSPKPTRTAIMIGSMIFIRTTNSRRLRASRLAR